MTTITLKLKTKRDVTQIFDFAKKSNIYMQVVTDEFDKPIIKKPVLSRKEKNKAILELSKSIKKSIHEKYAKPILDDYYNR
jgi:hypothetical protein